VETETETESETAVETETEKPQYTIPTLDYKGEDFMILSCLKGDIYQAGCPVHFSREGLIFLLFCVHWNNNNPSTEQV